MVVQKTTLAMMDKLRKVSQLDVSANTTVFVYLFVVICVLT